MSGIGAAEYISSQLAYWKRNELIRQASLNLNGNTMRWDGRAGRGFVPARGQGRGVLSASGAAPGAAASLGKQR